MSDEVNASLLKYKEKLQVTQPELSYAKRSLERKPIFAVEIPYPVLKEWHKIVSTSGTTTKYIDFLEATIPSGLFTFSDDEIVRQEVNNNLAKISGSVVQLYKNTKGRAREKLNERTKKYHIFEGQNKPATEFKAEITKIQEEFELEKGKLQEEIEDWRRRYKDLEKEKESIFNEMVKILSEKDKIIGHLQQSNHELEVYIDNIEKHLDLQKKYQGKPISETKNKSRSMKTFMSRAEVALWFSESFGLEIEALNVKECTTGMTHVLNFISNKQCVTEL